MLCFVGHPQGSLHRASIVVRWAGEEKKIEMQIESLVRFSSKEEALRAAKELDGSILGSETLAVKLDPASPDNTRISVMGVSKMDDGFVDLLKSHFSAVGQVEFVNHGVGEVRFATEEGARQAVEQLDGTVLRGRTIVVVLDSKSPDNTKVKVIGLNPRIRFKPIKEHFSQAGEVSFVAAPGQAGKQR